MRIAFDATAIPRNRAGAGVYIFNVVQALAQVDALSEYVIFARPEFIAEFGITQPNFTFVPVMAESQHKRLLWEQTGLPRAVRRMGIDVLHSPHYTMPLRVSCRTVVTFHDMIFFLMPDMMDGRGRTAIFQKMMQWGGRHADRLIAVSESTRQDMLRVLHIRPERVVSIPEAAHGAFRRLPAMQAQATCARYDLVPGRFILFVGVLEPRKNVPLLLKAYARLASEFPDVPLAIAGKKGWMFDEIFEQVTALSLADRVRFLGYVPEDDLVGLYNTARVFAYPSRYEGFGLPVLEGLQCGAPVDHDEHLQPARSGRRRRSARRPG